MARATMHYSLTQRLAFPFLPPHTRASLTFQRRHSKDAKLKVPKAYRRLK
eukprot:CAMPEP_0205931498 /NCGR_PEP_ID=MMETSP1325-20131115/27487_1 /ASSEMBLY_ACC=CAM_ASM_000708 /TAXON_ID=236786 /ORGANISM="Florenciella sp., Strain RCC1007" /LENGTH=49 /DNA_ID= /DNA_START= /DNA_END= /DNA_ORIENTATION=